MSSAYWELSTEESPTSAFLDGLQHCAQSVPFSYLLTSDSPIAAAQTSNNDNNNYTYLICARHCQSAILSALDKSFNSRNNSLSWYINHAHFTEVKLLAYIRFVYEESEFKYRKSSSKFPYF